jgi:GNAT superfamily N-acetyltransferase
MGFHPEVEMAEARSTRLSISYHVTEQELVWIKKRLECFSQEKTGNRLHYPAHQEPGMVFNLAVTESSGTVVGGISVSSVLGVMWLETLWVDEKHRRRGLASWLVLEAERAASERDCVGAGTWTFSWQGPEFYPRVGYELNGVYEGYPLGTTEHVLSKPLPEPPGSPLAVRGSKLASHLARSGYCLVTDPPKEAMRVVHDGLHAFCVENAGDELSNPGIDVRLALRDEEEQIVGGLLASTTVRVMALEQLWVDAEYRGKGFGKKLLAEAERIAAEHGCIAVQGSCLSFQAPEFFFGLGYDSFGTVEVYLDGHIEHLLSKPLPAAC